MPHDKKKRRARRKKKEKAAAQHRADGERRHRDLRFLAWTVVVAAVLGAAAALGSFWRARVSIIDHGMCSVCMLQGPVQLLILSLGLITAAVLVALRWRNVRKELARR